MHKALRSKSLTVVIVLMALVISRRSPAPDTDPTEVVNPMPTDLTTTFNPTEAEAKAKADAAAAEAKKREQEKKAQEQRLAEAKAAEAAKAALRAGQTIQNGINQGLQNVESRAAVNQAIGQELQANAMINDKFKDGTLLEKDRSTISTLMAIAAMKNLAGAPSGSGGQGTSDSSYKANVQIKTSQPISGDQSSPASSPSPQLNNAVATPPKYIEPKGHEGELSFQDTAKQGASAVQSSSTPETKDSPTQGASYTVPPSLAAQLQAEKSLKELGSADSNHLVDPRQVEKTTIYPGGTAAPNSQLPSANLTGLPGGIRQIIETLHVESVSSETSGIGGKSGSAPNQVRVASAGQGGQKINSGGRYVSTETGTSGVRSDKARKPGQPSDQKSTKTAINENEKTLKGEVSPTAKQDGETKRPQVKTDNVATSKKEAGNSLDQPLSNLIKFIEEKAITNRLVKVNRGPASLVPNEPQTNSEEITLTVYSKVALSCLFFGCAIAGLFSLIAAKKRSTRGKA